MPTSTSIPPQDTVTPVTHFLPVMGAGGAGPSLNRQGSQPMGCQGSEKPLDRVRNDHSKIWPGYRMGRSPKTPFAWFSHNSRSVNRALLLDQGWHWRMFPRIETPHLLLGEWLFLLDISLSEALVPSLGKQLFILGTLEWERPLLLTGCVHNHSCGVVW